MIKGIIFDIGDVLIKDGVRDYAYEGAAKHYGVSLKKIKEIAKKQEECHDRPEFNEVDYWNKFALTLGSDKPPKLLWTEKYIGVSPINQEVLGLVRRLKGNGYELAVLSNTIPPHLEANRARGLFDLFDSTTFSCELEVSSKKPDSTIYQKCLERINSPADQYIFVDDKWENLPPAQRLGMKIIHYSGANNLRLELMSWDINV